MTFSEVAFEMHNKFSELFSLVYDNKGSQQYFNVRHRAHN